MILFDYDVQRKKYDNNIHSYEQLKELCQNIKQLPSSPDIFIDQEGGKVRRLKETQGFAPLPSAEDFSKLGVETKKAVLLKSYSQMKELGIDYNLAPVIDINLNSDNPNIGALKRSFSSSTEVIEENLLLINEVAKETNLKLCLKHYPGLGGATTDSHNCITDISKTLNDSQLELFYKYGNKIHGQAILVSHGFVKQWDETFPCTLSEPIISRLKQKCPDTLIISDDMQMHGVLDVSGSLESACQKALKAGVHRICIGNNLQDDSKNLWDIFSRLERENLETISAEK